jgi:hypothetical protein
MYRSPVEAAAVAWNEARLKACAAPVEGFAKDKKGDMVAMPNPQVWTDLGAAETDLSKAVAALLDREAEMARLAARPKLFVVHGKKNFADHEVEVCPLEEAILEASGAWEWGTWAPAGVRTVAGELVLDEEQLSAKVYEMVT